MYTHPLACTLVQRYKIDPQTALEIAGQVILEAKENNMGIRGMIYQAGRLLAKKQVSE